MKLKNRSIIALVERVDNQTKHTVPIAAFRTPERADEYVGECQQKFDDLNIAGFTFRVGGIVYYDE